MIALLCALVTLCEATSAIVPAGRVPGPSQPSSERSSPLRLDLRIFDGLTEVTDDTVVTIHDAGGRSNPRAVPLAPNGERQIALPAGQYDLQLLHQDEGRVLAVRWTSLRLLVAYPGEHGQHLEVLNLRPGYGARQVRRAGPSAEAGTLGWTATLRRHGRDEVVATPLPGDGYVLFVAPPGHYDLEIRPREGEPRLVRGVDIRDNLTYLTSW